MTTICRKHEAESLKCPECKKERRVSYAVGMNFLLGATMGVAVGCIIMVSYFLR